MSAKTNKGLGRGFDALLPSDFNSTVLNDSSERVEQIAVTNLSPNVDQPRKQFDETSLKQLADSIKQHGVLQPLIVQPHDGKSYQIIAGERRWRAAIIAGLKTVPAIIRSAKQMERLELALVENVQRVDLSAIEQALSIDRLHQQFNLSFDEIGRRLGKASSTMANMARLLQLPEEAKRALHDHKLGEGHARQILALTGYPEKQHELLELMLKKDLSVREAERFVNAFRKSSPEIKTSEIQAKIKSETPATKQLGKRLGHPVSIRFMARGGKLEISFGSDTQLEELISRLLSSISQ